MESSQPGSAGFGAQTPIEPGRLQALQASVHPDWQQTPSTQKPETHSPAVEQLSPMSSVPLHAPFTHSAEALQSASLVQLVRQPEASQRAHWPSQAESQQTPSTQWPEAQSFPEVQLVPFDCLGSQLPPMQA